MAKNNTFQWHKPTWLNSHLLLGAVAIMLIAYGAWGLVQWFTATHNKPTISQSVVRHSTDHPDETPPTEACKEYQVATDEPRMLELPSLGISGCIQKVGVDEASRIAVPPNVHLAGWFVDSVRPGDSGVSIINGHVQGNYQPAIFKRLGEAKPGELVRVQLGDKSWREATIASVDSYDIDRVATEQFRRLDKVDKQLTLITCGGYDHASKTYQKRVLVRAAFKQPVLQTV